MRSGLRPDEKDPDVYTPERVARLTAALKELPQVEAALKRLPTTLVHNDTNPRNTCFKQGNFCLYDWELATQHVPVYDVVELLCFLFDQDRYGQRQEYFAYYQEQLAQHSDAYANPDTFREAVRVAAICFGVHRLGLYMMAHGLSPYPFIPRVADSYFDLLAEYGG